MGLHLRNKVTGELTGNKLFLIQQEESFYTLSISSCKSILWPGVISFATQAIINVTLYIIWLKRIIYVNKYTYVKLKKSADTTITWSFGARKLKLKLKKKKIILKSMNIPLQVFSF